MTRIFYLSGAVGVALTIGGCTVGPDFLRPSAPEDTGYTPEPLAVKTASVRTRGGETQHFLAARDIPGDWWTLFHSASLNRLIEQSLRANPDLDAAQAALRQAQENLYAGEGALYPNASLGIQAEKQRFSGASFGQPSQHATFGLVTPSLNISYVPDVFGGTRRQIESLEAQAEYQGFQLEAAYLTLTSNVVVAAVQEASLRGQIAATEAIIKDQAQSLNLVRQRFSLGGASQADVLTQEAQLAQTRATLPPLQKQLAQTRNQLTALAGALPAHETRETFSLDSMRLPQDLPVSLPSQLVEQRPDIRAAEAQMHSASAEIGVATANQLPQFSITAALGTASTSFTNMFAPGSGVWSIAGGITQTLFDAGTLLHKKRAAVAAFEQTAAQYRSTVIKACQNVADALRALQSDAEAMVAQSAAERSAAASLDLARRQYQLGAIDYLTLLNAQRTWQQARISLVQAEANRYADTAALFQALGGGWWHRSDMTRVADNAKRP
ncbi:MAG TPA: efflux transporter outer membrane subunit [Acetobacteraceae bacterium]|nr:efflux transporter outer membrane subunit [Acetobacteraceae bacterium]